MRLVRDSFLAWFKRILHGEEDVPEDWSTALMIIIPKIARPVKSKELRPICLGSATSKLFSRMLLGRTLPSLHYGTLSQVMGEGRQSADYLWSMSRIMQLEQEWTQGLWAVKLDVAKAFDSLDRKKFLHRLALRLGSTDVLRCWWDIFTKTEALLRTTWGSTTVDMRSGIRQGVSNPRISSLWLSTGRCRIWLTGMHEVVRVKDTYEGLGVSEAAYVDDILA